jgi:hypothetical protein
MGTGVHFWGQSGQGIKLTTQLHMMPRLRMHGTVTMFPLYTFIAWSGKILPFLVAQNTGSFTPPLSSWHSSDQNSGILLFLPLQPAPGLLTQVTLDTELIS